MPKRPSLRPPHRPPHVPTEQNRNTVREMAAHGILQPTIARVLGICVDTMAKYYAADMERAIVDITVEVAKGLHHNAVVNQSVTAQIAWLDRRGGLNWKTTQHHELTGRDGEAIMLVTGVVRDIKDETAPVLRLPTHDDAAD